MNRKAEDVVKEEIRTFLAQNIKKMMEDINSLDNAKDRVAAMQKLLDYVMPKQQAVKTTEASTQSAADFLLSQEAGLL